MKGFEVSEMHPRPTRREVYAEFAKVVLPRLALGAVALVGGAYLLWGADQEPSPQPTPHEYSQPPAVPAVQQH